MIPSDRQVSSCAQRCCLPDREFSFTSCQMLRVVFQGSNTIFWGNTFLSILDMQRCTGIWVTWAHLWQGARHYLHPAEEKTKGALGTYRLFSVEVNMDIGEMRGILMKSSLLHCTSTLISTPAAKLSFICCGLSWTEADVRLLTSNIRCSFSKQVTFCSLFTFR